VHANERFVEIKMAKFKYIDTHPRLIAVDLSRQLLPGTLEHALHHLLEHEIDLSHFDARYRNDDTGALAYPPAVLLKVVLFAYSQGIVSSRGIERACQEHVTFMALCGDHAPHFTTIARSISTLGDDIAKVFAGVLAVCDAEGLIGREMFAIDGVKLPSNASKQRSGTRADFEKQATKLEAAARTMLQRHRAADTAPSEPPPSKKAIQRLERLQRDALQMRAWLAANPDERRGPKRKVRQSNRTDNESAKMATSKGVIQRYTGVATVDAQHQIIIDAQAHGTGSEAELLMPVVDAIAPPLRPHTVLTADAGYHSEANPQQLAARQIPALIADQQMRKRDARFATQARHQVAPHPLHNKRPDRRARAGFPPSAFAYDAAARTCVCPAGKFLYRKGQSRVVNGYVTEQFRGTKQACAPCALRAQCLRTPDTTPVRNVAFGRGRAIEGPSHTEQMRQRIDTDDGRAQYARRFATVEPVFGNVRYNKGLDRFTLRGRGKVNAQWTLFCLVHNIEKLAKLKYAA